MKKRLFERLVESMEQHNEIIRGSRAPSRETRIDAVAVRAIQKDPKNVMKALAR